MAQRIVGIDIGAESVKVVRLAGSLRSFAVSAYDEEPLPAEAPEGAELEGFLGRAQEALRRLRERGALRGDLFVTGLPGELTATRLVRLPFKDPKRIEATLEFEVEAQVPFALEDMVMTRHVLSGQIDGQTDILVGVAKREDVGNFLDMLKGVGVDPRYVELDALALDDLHRHVLLRDEGKQEPQVTPGGTAIARGPDAYAPAAAVVDIGHSRTAICVVAADQVVAARTVLRGGADLTRALAKTFELPLPEAEEGKRREAFIEVPGSEAPYPEQERISACLIAALQPIVREIRQSIQAVIAQRRARVDRIYLCGGGARIHNLDRYLAHVLNIQVSRSEQISALLAPAVPVDPGMPRRDMTHAAKALAYALSGYAARKTERLDFRQGEFAYRGDFELLEGRAAFLAAGLMVIALLLGFNGYATHFVLSRQEARVVRLQREACRKILGRDMNSAERCLAMMREQIDGSGVGASIPERTAIDSYLATAQATPADVEVKVEELEITLDRVRIKGQTDSFESVDKIVDGLKRGRCFTNVERGPARQSGAKVGWSVSLDVECEAKAAPAPADEAAAAEPAGEQPPRPARPTSSKPPKKPAPRPSRSAEE